MGYKFCGGEQVIAREYYKKCSILNSTYVLLKNSHVVLLYSHQVWATKFLMILNDYHVEGNIRRKTPFFDLSYATKKKSRKIHF
jgi:hypothetical protein